MAQRIRRHPFLALFDGADPNGSTPTRSISTVPTQALYFMNDRFVHEQSEQFAKRLASTDGTEPERIARAYEWTLGRPPCEAERVDALEFLAKYRSEVASANPATAATAAAATWAAFSRSLFGCNEFMHID